MTNQPRYKKDMNVKVRFAPSPTGMLHAGNIRIAILNYLFSKKSNGIFVLRIDDTDLERSTDEYKDLIFKDLAWLGIRYDELYSQSKHITNYKSAFEKLKKSGRIYQCYETKDELFIKRKYQLSRGAPPVYDRSALTLTDDQKRDFAKIGIAPYWRFKLNDSSVVEWADLVHGKISIPLNTVSDPVLVKADGSFVYTFASVVDDINIGITHIIRGDDHITNTASQIDIFKALSDNDLPTFAHIPLLSSINGEEVSKRTASALSIANMREEGILPETILNILSTIGTSNDIICSSSIDDLTDNFSFEKLSLSSPKFNIEDVKILNKKILSSKFFEDVKTELRDLGLENATEYFWDTIKNNISKVSDSKYWYDILYNSSYNSWKAVDRVFIEQMRDTLPDPFDFDIWISKLKNVSEKKGADLFHPIRIVLTGLDSGPELRRMANILGSVNIKSRIEKNLK